MSPAHHRVLPSRALSLLTAFACLALLLASGIAHAATRAWLDRSEAREGETVTLNIETDQPGVAPDYAPLEAGFEVGTPYRSTRANAGPGALFGVRLVPRRSGNVEVPALQVGRERTAPLLLQVAPARQAARGGEAFLETRVDEPSPWVQQSVGVTLRLYFATSLLSGELTQEPPEGASLQRIGDDATGRERIGGREYQYVERRFLLVPERSGPLQLPAPRFRGKAAPRFFDDFFGTERSMAAEGSPRLLQVRAQPADAPQPWLPLRGLELRYLQSPRTGRAGEALELVVEARADGASAAQPLELPAPRVDGAQVFAERAETTERFVDGRPQLTVVRRFAVVPQQAGSLVIPAMHVPWWDATSGQPRRALLPALKLEVGASAQAPRTTLPPGSQAMADDGDDAIASGLSADPGQARPASTIWPWLALLLGLLWLATLAWALRLRARGSAPVSGKGGDPAGVAPPTTADLRHALDADSFGEAVRLLQAMARPPAADLDEVVARLADPRQREALQAMRRALWAGDGDPSAAREALRRVFRDGPRWSGDPADDGEELLPPLYPPGQGR